MHTIKSAVNYELMTITVPTAAAGVVTPAHDDVDARQKKRANEYRGVPE